MGYREDLIQRLKDSGEWESLTGEKQRMIEKLSDEEARIFMVKADEWEMGEPGVQMELAASSLELVMKSFDGALIRPQPIGDSFLSDAGLLFAEFLIEAQQRTGWSWGQISDALKEFDMMTIAALLTIYHGPKQDSE